MELDLNPQAYESLNSRLRGMHERMLDLFPALDRVAVALYDPQDDLLTTFINSTREGAVLTGYQYRLSDSRSLSYLARTRELRLLDDLPEVIEPTTAHSRYVLAEGYRSSYTAPLYHGGSLLGFIFFDSRTPHAFTPEICQELRLHSTIVNLTIVSQLQAVRAIIGATRIAQGFTALRDVETGAHMDRVATLTRLIMRRLVAELGLTDEFVEQVYIYAPLHDIGKVGIPDHILLKPGRLTPAEFDIMKTHTTIGRDMVVQMITDLKLTTEVDVSNLTGIVASHHERLDGSGYPEGLSGSEVPMAAALVAVADVFDAVTSPRPYRRPWSVAEGFALITEQAEQGKLLAPAVAALIAQRDAVESVRRRLPDTAGD